MAALAQDKKRTMDAVIRNVEAQGRHVRMVADGFDKIREASKKVLGVVSGIMDISEKTNMLAMNASIEAAHAGSAGKGFAVIAQEIRKLSDESRSNTESVQAALVQNDALVRQVSEAAGTFTTEISTINKDVRATFDAMDELISGLSGIASSTRELMSAVTMMVETANEASRDVGVVVDRVGSGSSSVAEISRFSCELENQVDRVGLEFAAIEGALNRIQTIGERNIEQFALFEKDLKAIQT
jgi:methyl-accepting chemotaxis protein